MLLVEVEQSEQHNASHQSAGKVNRVFIYLKVSIEAAMTRLVSLMFPALPVVVYFLVY